MNIYLFLVKVFQIMNFNFLKTKHYYFYCFESNTEYNSIRGDRLVEIINYFWIKPNIGEIMEFAKNKLKEELNTKEFVIINFYKVK